MSKINYREIYCRHYGIADPGHDFDIHHIDFNRDNNDVDNLIMLPNKLHHQYHFAMSALNSASDPTSITFDGKIDMDNRYERTMLRHLVDALDEIENWRILKDNADMKIFMRECNGREKI